MLGDVVYYNAPTTSFASDVSYETAPQYATYVEAPVSYAAAPQVTYTVAAPAPATYTYSVPAHQQQQLPQLQSQISSLAFDTSAQSSSSSIDSYGAPLATVIG